MTISGNIIDHPEKKVQSRAYVRVENFGVKHKHSSGFQKEDMPYALSILVNTTISVLIMFVLELLPIFYTKTYIRDF